MFASNPAIVKELGNFFDQQYDDYWAKSLSNRITKNRHNIMASISNVLERHLTPASAGETVATPAEVGQYTWAMEEAVNDQMQQMLIARFPDQTMQSTEGRTLNEQRLWDSLDHMRCGRMRRAVKGLVAYWSPEDFETLMTSGMEVYDEGLDDQTRGIAKCNLQFTLLRSKGIDKRSKDIKSLTSSELQHLKACTVSTKLKSYHQKSILARGLTQYYIFFNHFIQQPLVSFLPIIQPIRNAWDFAYYGPEFVNVWLYILGENYWSTGKLSITELSDASKRMGHVAYLVCYENSLMTRQIMSKLCAEDHSERKGKERAQSHPTGIVGSIAGTETGSGPCTTMSLLNFLINQHPTTHGEPIQQLFQRVTALQQINKDYRGEAQKDPVLCSLHHYVLCDQQLQQDEKFEVEEEVAYMSSEGNHLILILPFAGHIWEVDSLEPSGPLWLGASLGDWTATALHRLEMWWNTTQQTKIPVDIQAILQER
ncbi:hypothetical protein BGX28_000529 [Mortierella sp. GBA30]|nr:hypothetical protein BGX28_000529 [Mortierella sp. GBA30]